MAQDNSILTVGSLAFDTIKTPEGSGDALLGGSCNYFSIAASIFAPVKIVGVVGTDFPTEHIGWLKNRGVDTTGVEVAEGKTFHWSGEYEGDMNEAQTLATDLNVFATFDPKLTDEHRDAGFIFLANIDPNIQLKILEQAKNHRFVALDTMNFWIEGSLKPLKDVIRQVDLLSINEGEAQILSGKKNLIEAVEVLRDLGPSVIIIKRGEYGSMLFTAEGNFFSPAFPVRKLIDPTGAGDSFAGGLMGYLANQGIDRAMAQSDPKGYDHLLRKAVLTGCATASFTVEDFSFGKLGAIERSSVDGRREELIRMMTV